MKFCETGASIMRNGDIRCFIDRTLCWLFHARKYWRGDWINELNAPVLKCLKCDWKWIYQEDIKDETI